MTTLSFTKFAGHSCKAVSTDDGYAMIALLVGLNIMAVMMTVAMPMWKQMAQREKETELVFRGQQYAHAIGLFQRKNGPGTLPPNIDVLVEQRFLRKKYRDPITNDDFQPLRAGQIVGTAQQPASGQAASRGSAASTGQPSVLVVGTGRAGVGSTTSGAGNSPATGGGASGGIMGVTSKSTGTSIRLYQGRAHYNEWAFIYVQQVQAPGGVGAGGVPGGGRRSSPGSSGAEGVGDRAARGRGGNRAPSRPAARGPIGPRDAVQQGGRSAFAPRQP